jgi:hypothetical protein
MRLRMLAAIVSIGLLTANRAHADPIVLFNTFGAGDTFHLGGGHTVLADPAGSTQFQRDIDTANAFQVSAASRLESVQLALSRVPESGFPGGHQFVSIGRSADVFLLSDIAGSPGSLLESFHLDSVADTPAIYTLMSPAGPMLSRGAQYWLAVSTGPDPTLITWHSSGQPISGLVAQRNDEGPWRVTRLFGPNGVDAFRIIGVGGAPTVPEPSTLLLVLSALIVTRRGRIVRRPFE